MHLKIAVVVHGRFHAFDLVRELIHQGHEVTLFTNYPKYFVEKFGIPRTYVRSFLLHGFLSRIFHRINKLFYLSILENFFCSLFAVWAANKICQEQYDLIHCFSGVSEEVFKSVPSSKSLKVLVRGSSHIRVQNKLLEEEKKRSSISVSIEKPSAWMTAREEREYQISDIVLVLSTFAKKSFIQQGFDQKKLRLLPLGAELSKFRPAEIVIDERCQRILSRQPLRILMVGTLSLRKGAIDFVEIAKTAGSAFNFQFVGAVTAEASFLFRESSQYIKFIPKMPQLELPLVYGWADVFIFTTVEDGYAVVLSQAQAAGLPILATTNCAAPDIVTENQTGWVLPIRSPEAFLERLNWCNEHRQELAQMVRRVYEDFQPRDWADVASDFTKVVTDTLTRSKK
ncbi:MAG: glycosyltransferase family 4 protein [Aulosira sp. DedQUE10]|nr:glycosyltransferase family 4 protein [Aulosira sp. DedQUE10]